MCQTIEELDIKNDKAHRDMETKLDNTLKEVKELVNNAVSNLETTAQQLSISFRINKFQKWIIGGMGLAIILMAGWLVVLGGSVLSANRMSAAASAKSANIRYNSYILLDSIHKELKVNNNLTKSFNSTAFKDTIEAHWDITLKFLNNDWKKEVSFTHTMYKQVIYPTEILSKKNSLLIKDHEKRITNLEKLIR